MSTARRWFLCIAVASSAVGCVIGPKPEDPSLSPDTGTTDDGGDLRDDATADTKSPDTGIAADTTPGADTSLPDASGDATPPPSDGEGDGKTDGVSDGASDAAGDSTSDAGDALEGG